MQTERSEPGEGKWACSGRGGNGAFYKGHRIEVSVWLDGDGWFASLFIYYSKGPQNRLVTFAVNDTFRTYDGDGHEVLNGRLALINPLLSRREAIFSSSRLNW
jgi:hypothetical protein